MIIPSIQIIQGECIEKMKSFKDGCIDVILTDPPYKYLNHKLDRSYNEQDFMKEAYRVLKKDGIICFFGRGYFLSLLCVTAIENGFKFLEEVVRDKIACSSPFLDLQRTHELVYIFTKNNGKINKVKVPYEDMRDLQENSLLKNDIKRIKSALINKEDLKDILHFIETGSIVYSRFKKSKHGLSVSSHQGIRQGLGTIVSLLHGMKEKSIIRVNKEHYQFKHPTQKPIKLMERLIDLVSKPGDTILDPFAGSGSTGIACLNKNRNSILIEIDEEYINVINDRIKIQTEELKRKDLSSGLFDDLGELNKIFNL